MHFDYENFDGVEKPLSLKEKLECLGIGILGLVGFYAFIWGLYLVFGF